MASIDQVQSTRTTVSTDDTFSTDLENQSLNTLSANQTASSVLDVKKQLFQTPATTNRKARVISYTPRTPAPRIESPTNSVQSRTHSTKPAPYVSNFRTRRTSTAITPAVPSTARRRPNIARIPSTPGVRRRYVASAPEMWRNQQKHDLTAWLNSELVDPSLNGSYLAWENITGSVVFLKQIGVMHQLYKSVEMQSILKKVDREIAERRFFITRSISLFNHDYVREDIANLLLYNYHPIWLMLALSVILGFNFAPLLDETIGKAKEYGQDADLDSILTEVLHNVISQQMLTKEFQFRRKDVATSASKRRSTASQSRDQYNGIVLSRILHLILLLDRAKLAPVPIISTDPPLFRYKSDIGSSEEVIQYLAREYLKEQGNVVKFLKYREYRVRYEAPILERMGSLFVKDLSKDLIDGTRLCKLASVMIRDKEILDSIRKVKSGMTKQKTLSCHIWNVGLALNKIQHYVAKHSKGPFGWEATHSDIVNGDLDKTIRVLWQIVSLWLEIVVLDRKLLERELNIVQQQFRDSNAGRRGTLSPASLEISGNVSLHKISPSRIEVYENCDSVSSTLLLKWCATVAGIYGVAVRDYTESFRDGAALCLILHHYCPELLSIEEVTRIKLAELRSVNDSEAEAELARRNFDLFTHRCRLLGNFPHIPISVQAALAPSFSSSEKGNSFGRLMEVLCAYLFKRLILEKERGSVELNVQQLLNAQQLSTFDGQLDSTASSRRSSSSSLSELCGVREGVVHDEEIENEKPGASPAQRSDHVRLDDDTDAASSSAKSNDFKSSESLSYIHRSPAQGPSPKPGVHLDALEHNEAPDHQVVNTSNRASYGAKEQAAITILRYYRTWKKAQLLERQRNCVKDIQNVFRRFQAQAFLQDLSAQAGASNVPQTLSCSSPNEENARKSFSRGTISEMPETTNPMKIALHNKVSIDTFPSDLVAPPAVSGVLGNVHTVLSCLGTHAEAMRNFAQRMLTMEKDIAASTMQQTYRSFAARKVLDTKLQEVAKVQETKSLFKTVLTSIPQAAATVAQRIAMEATKRREEHMAIISAALQKAAQACLLELAKREETRQAERRRLRQDRLKQFEESQAKQAREEKESMQADFDDLRRKLIQLETRLKEHENTSDERDENNGAHSSRVGMERALGVLEMESLAESQTDSLQNEDVDLTEAQLREQDLENLRKDESETLTDLINFHQNWSEDLSKRQEWLCEREALLLSSLLELAERAYNLRTAEAMKQRSDTLEKHRVHQEAGKALQKEEYEASEEFAFAESQVAGDIMSLASQVSESQAKNEEITARAEKRCDSVNNEVVELSRSLVTFQQSERDWNSAIEAYDTEALEAEEMLSEWRDQLDVENTEEQQDYSSPGVAVVAQAAEEYIHNTPDKHGELYVHSQAFAAPTEAMDPRTPDVKALVDEQNVPSSIQSNYSASWLRADQNSLTGSDSPGTFRREQPTPVKSGESSRLRPGKSSAMFEDSSPGRSETTFGVENHDLVQVGVLSSIENHFRQSWSTQRSTDDVVKLDARQESSNEPTKHTDVLPKSDTASITSDGKRLSSPQENLPIETELRNIIGTPRKSQEFAITPDVTGLDGLTQELNELNLDTPSVDKVQAVLRSPVLSQKLDSALRRLSSALASPPHLAALNRAEDVERAAWEINLIRTVFIIIQQCTRTRSHLALVESGISIIKEFATDEERIDRVVCAEDCLDVLVTCIQFYRDCEAVLPCALETFIALSWHPLVAADLRADDGFKRRLTATYHLMKLEAQRVARHQERLRRTEIIMNALSASRKTADQSVPISQQIEAERSVAIQDDSQSDSLILFEKLLSRFMDREKQAPADHFSGNTQVTHSSLHLDT